jgi:hypothetical protein
MRISVRGLIFAGGLIWGATFALVAFLNFRDAAYGAGFLSMLSSMYPGFHNTRAMTDIWIGVGYSVADGAITGLLFAWVYNTFRGRGDN